MKLTFIWLPSVLLLVLTLGLAGCSGGSRGSGPQDVLQRYLKAIETDQPTVAYDLLHKNVRRSVSRTEFIRRWKEMRPELKAQAATLKKQPKLSVKAGASLVYSSGIRMKVVYDKSKRWNLENGFPVVAHTPTPVHAIKAFLSAVEQRNFRALMKLLSKSKQQRTEERVDTWVSGLKEALELADEIEVSGTTARLKFGNRHSIELVQQEGQWKVTSVDY